MKSYVRNALIALFALMFILSITHFANAAGPSVNLPPGTVNATYLNPGPVSYWSITLSSVPSGYDVTNGYYVGWCCDETFTIYNGATLYGVMLYSSYNPLQPWRGGDAGWNKVNYIINHKQGTPDDVQAAIWHYMDSNGGNQNDPNVMAMEAAADANAGFVPAPGQLLAVVVYQAGSQATFIEVPLPVVQLTVTSAYDSPTPTSGSYAPGTGITESVTPIVNGPAGTRYVCTGWTGTGSVPATGTTTSVTFTITQDSSITWLWTTQYQLNVNSAHGTAAGAGWYNAGSPASFSVSPTTVAGGAGTQYVFTGWSSSDTGGYTGSTSSTSVTMNDPITETANWKTQYSLTVTSAYGSPTGQGWYDSGSTASSSVTSPAGNEWSTGWTGTGSAPSTGQAKTLTFKITQASTVTWNWAYASVEGPSVGGQWAPITMQALTPVNTLQLLAPWIALATIVAVSAVATYRCFTRKHW